MSTTPSNAAGDPSTKPGTQPVVTAELLRVEDVCVLLRTTRRTIYRLADAGKIPFGIKLNGMRRWRKAELMDWLAAGCPPVRVAKGAAR